MIYHKFESINRKAKAKCPKHILTMVFTGVIRIRLKPAQKRAV